MYVGKIAFCGWAFHFGEFKVPRHFSDDFLYIFLSSSAPFLIMGRVTYLHHYVSFACVLLGYKSDSFFYLFSYQRYISPF